MPGYAEASPGEAGLPDEACAGIRGRSVVGLEFRFKDQSDAAQTQYCIQGRL